MLVSEPHFESRERFRALRRAFTAGAEQAQKKGRPILVSVTLPTPPIDPISFFENGANVDSTRLFWSAPEDDLTLVGIGAASRISDNGDRRFAKSSQAWKSLLADAHTNSPPNTPGVGPLLMGGFSFDPLARASAPWEKYPDALLAIPRFLLTTSSPVAGASGPSWFTANAVIEPGRNPEELVIDVVRAEETLMEQSRSTLHGSPDRDLPPNWLVEDVRPEEWKRAVHQLAADVRAGRLEKGVLARNVRVRSSRPFEVGRVLDALRTSYPDCRMFAVGRGDKCFMGATPERLVRLRRGRVEAMCLAGTIARGKTEAEDQRLGEELRKSAKNGTEHAVVVRMLREALSHVCLDVSPSAEPTLLKLPNVQHLHTPVTARLQADRTLLDVVERLHPTPAVGGFPRDEALRWIREHEGLDRGWYAGPVGWVDPTGDGEFAVAIRSALVDGPTASLFAGCGIVADSTPESEYEESQWKLRPMLGALSASLGNGRAAKEAAR